MGITPTRAAAAIAALASGAIAVYALQPGGGAPSSTVSSRPAGEVRTEVIRRTIDVAGRESEGGAAGSAGSGTQAAGVSTRTSGANATSGASASTAPVITRTSGAGGESESGGEHERGGDD